MSPLPSWIILKMIVIESQNSEMTLENSKYELHKYNKSQQFEEVGLS